MQKARLEFFDTRPPPFVGGTLFSIVCLVVGVGKVICLKMPGILWLILYWNEIRKISQSILNINACC